MDTQPLDPQLGALASSPYGARDQSMPAQAEVDDFLRKKRKAREHKACYPCRQRKVKCDLSRPCQTCRDRDHPELCSYHPPNKRQVLVANGSESMLRPGEDVYQAAHPSASMLRASEEVYPPDPSQDSGYVSIGRGELDMLFRKLDGLENSIADMRREMARNSRGDQNGTLSRESEAGAGGEHEGQTHTDVHGLHTKNESGEIVHLGGGSVPAMLYALGQGQSSSGLEQAQLQEFLGKSVLPLFGLDNESATYPFVDLWGLPHGSLQRARELAKALPSDSQMLSLFRGYQSMGYVIYPGITDLNQLETDLMEFLATRRSYENPEDGVTEQMLYGRSFYWLGMLFAVLASGAQSSAMTRTERELTSQVYVCCGFECLRFTNFLSQPHIESIETLLLIGNVMTNNMNAGTAWSLLGLTIRLAQALGLHQACPPHITADVVFPRSKLWWAIVWQDSLLSITYDRNASLDVNTMPMPQHFGAVSPYHASMYRMCKIVLDIVRDRARVQSPREMYPRIKQHQEEIETLMREVGSIHLRDSRACHTSQETLEHWALYLHTSYAMSELCRPAISPRMSSEPDIQKYKTDCIANLTNVVDAFLGLNNITFFARQSWAAVHRALSSSLLLGILGEHTKDPRVRALIAAFINLMGDITSTVDKAEISAPVQRGIEALRKLNLDEASPRGENAARTNGDTVVGSVSEGILKFESKGTSPAGSGTDEHSPYSVLNHILWGGNHGSLQAEVPAM